MKKLNILLLGIVVILCSFITNAQINIPQIDAYLDQRLENNELTDQDVSWEITGRHVSSASGIEHIYFRQTIEGIPVYGTESGMHLLPGGEVLSANDRFISNTNLLRSSSDIPSLTASQAVQRAAGYLNYSISGPLNVINRSSDKVQSTLLSRGGISLSDIPVSLVYQRNKDGQLVLAWDLSIEAIGQTEWKSVRIDANTGELVDMADWMTSCSFDHDHREHLTEVLDYNANLYDIPNYDQLVARQAETAGCSECYQAFELPLESPFFGPFTTAVQPADPIASPFGWHDTNGVPGAEFTVTKGNNADAYEDGNNPGYQPDGGATLDFTGYPWNINYTTANQYEDAAITNLFYWNNVIHDVLYQYGFDEVAGNFQENNYGNGGNGGDSVDAEAQDGSGTCNANFGTPPDGSNPRMQMYICNNRDGDFDNMVIIHEYGHGISNRLTGGPSASGCLQNTEQMGEGWSDWYGAVMTMQAGDQGTDARGVGTYLFGQGPTGNGIRPFPYSTDLSVNPQTYDDIKTAAVPHGLGSVWASMLWEVTWALIDEHGWDPDIYNFTGDINQDAGNVQALAIVTEALKIQPCNPGFIDGRDAVIAADQAIYGGANVCRIWNAFAKRGLGLSADQGSSNSRTDGTEAFDTPSGVADFTAPEDVCASEGVLTGIGGGSPFGGVYSGPGVTDDGNGSTYSFDPAAAGVGVHTITYSVAAGPCSVASSDSDTIEVLAIPAGPTTTGATDICVGDSVTVTAVPDDPANVIRWFDSENGGNFLSEGTDYTFNPTSTQTLWAQENPPGPLSTLVISEITLETPDRLEVQNVGIAQDYSEYIIAVSEQPYTNINSQNTVENNLGPIAQDGVIDFSDDPGSPNYWGENIWWDNDGTGWIIIVDPNGNVVDSVFWGFTAAEIAQLNVTIGGFNITAADLDWTGAGAELIADCNGSFRRNGDTNSSADWTGICEDATYGVANEDIGIGFQGCLAARTPTPVTLDDQDPEVSCPDDVIVEVNEGELFSLPDYTVDANATDNCPTAPVLTQDPVAGTDIGPGTTVVTITATDSAGNEAICTFEVLVNELLAIEEAGLANQIGLYPNPATNVVNLVNNSGELLTGLTVTDVNGRTIQQLAIDADVVEYSINFSGLSTGMYFVRIETSETSLVKRVIKQ